MQKLRLYSDGSREGPVCRCDGCLHLLVVRIHDTQNGDIQLEAYCTQGSEHKSLGRFVTHKTPDWCPFLKG